LTETSHREVTLHALTARATLDTGPDSTRAGIVVAEALLELWPTADYGMQGLAATLRANTDVLTRHGPTGLIQRPLGMHVLLFRCGASLVEAGLYATGIQYWTHLATASERVLGGDHPDTLAALGNLAQSCWEAGRTDEAMSLQEQVLADLQRLHGSDHPTVLMARNNLAATYSEAGRVEDAIGLQEQVLADRRHELGADHPDTLTSRNNLAATYLEAGRVEDAVGLQERVLADRRRVLGGDHPDTLTSRNNLAVMYLHAGDVERGVEMLRRAAADLDRVLGPDHPSTVLARENLLEVTGEPQPEAAQDSSSRSPSSDAEPGSAV
ncbi:tetratricopeptide repeat protein, partial [Kitasatospora sp. NPDC091257]|uniref:tetratricopeptide repeat protein n=1 Tax=Kitasatospora sp. NPDC091257 TaxID=3364084 RepID=UPI00381DEFFC